MSNREIASGVFRAWGVMWLIYVLIALPQLLNAVLRHAYAESAKGLEAYFVSSQALSIGCEIVVAVFLLRKAGWLAGIVFPDEREIGLSFTAEAFQSVLIAVVALYFVLDGLRHAFGSAYQLLARPRGDSSNAFGYIWQRAPEDLARALGGLIVGALVLFARRRGGLLPAIRAAYGRYLGTRESPDEK